MWRALRPYLGTNRRIFALAASALIAGIAQAALLILVGQLAVSIATDRTQSLGPFEDVQSGTLFAMAFVISVVMMVAKTAAAATSARMSSEALAALRRRLTRAFLRASWDLRSREREGRLQEHLSNHAFHISTAVLGFGSLLAAAANLGALSVGAFIVDPVVAGLIALGGGILTLAFRPLMKVLRRTSRRQVQANLVYTSSVAESVRVAQELVVFDAADAFESKMLSESDAVIPWLYRARFLQRATPDWYRDSAFVAILVGLLIVDRSDSTEITSLTVIVLLLVRAITFARELQAGFTRFNEVTPYLEDVAEATREYRAAALPTGGSPVTSIEELHLAGVGYTYPGAEGTAIRGVDLTVRRGEAIGIVGPSGSGKSTLFQVLLRLRPPQEGDYLVNGTPIDQLEVASWYRRLAVVNQDLQLVSGSIADNIRFFRDGISDVDIEEAARAAHVHDEIVAMPGGYAAVVEGAGGGVSGGQRQRICLARALVGRPDAIFLDEPTSALDRSSEDAVSEALRAVKDDVILFVISHRERTLEVCDHILVMEGGEVAAFGPADEIARQADIASQAPGNED